MKDSVRDDAVPHRRQRHVVDRSPAKLRSTRDGGDRLSSDDSAAPWENRPGSAAAIFRFAPRPAAVADVRRPLFISCS